MKKLLCIDVGGTKTSVSIGTENGRILASQRFSTLPHKGLENFLVQLEKTVKELLSSHKIALKDICAIGLATPGPINQKKGLIISAPNMTGWYNVPLADEVAGMFHKKVFFNNDANAAALAEFMFGHGKKFKNMVYLTHSTGMGAGIIVDGKLLQGTTDMAGEVGHFVVEKDGPCCPCGLHGCFELYCGGRSFALRLQQQIKKFNIKTKILKYANGKIEQIDFKAFLMAAKSGDNFALKEWNEYVERLAQGLGIIIMTLNPDIIVLGTIARAAGNFLLNPLRKKIFAYAWKQAARKCIIQSSLLGESIGDLGALALAISGIHQK
jgi:glucokinase